MKQKITFVVCLLFGLVFINAGLNKFFNYMPVPENMPDEVMKLMQAFMTIGWLMPLVGVVEIMGGILFAIPLTRAIGAITILPIMVGIVLVHVLQAPDGLPMALGLAVINFYILFENREKYMNLLRR